MQKNQITNYKLPSKVHININRYYDIIYILFVLECFIYYSFSFPNENKNLIFYFKIIFKDSQNWFVFFFFGLNHYQSRLQNYSIPASSKAAKCAPIPANASVADSRSAGS